MNLEFEILQGAYEIVVDREGDFNFEKLQFAALLAMSKVKNETTIVRRVDEAKISECWRALHILTTFDFDEAGVVQSAVTPISSADIGVFVVSTYDSDLVLIQDRDLDGAVSALKAAGHSVRRSPPVYP